MVSLAMGAAMTGTMYFLWVRCAQHGGNASGGGLVCVSLRSYRALFIITWQHLVDRYLLPKLNRHCFSDCRLPRPSLTYIRNSQKVKFQARIKYMQIIIVLTCVNTEKPLCKEIIQGNHPKSRWRHYDIVKMTSFWQSHNDVTTTPRLRLLSLESNIGNSHILT